MKVSKFFHFLLFCLMFIPIASLVFNVLVNLGNTGFDNEHFINIIFDNTFVNYGGWDIIETSLLFDFWYQVCQLIFGTDYLPFFGPYLPHLFSYWTGITIMWLFFDVIEWFIQFAHKLLDGDNYKAKGGF